MSLFSALDSASGALSAYQRAMNVSQNNVENANTPGYAKQTQLLVAQPGDITGGLLGGVSAGDVASSRDEFSEQTVRGQNSALSFSTAAGQALGPIQGQFDISGTTGVPAALSSLYSAFSNWANLADDSTARTGVLSAASGLAASFNQAATAISTSRAGLDSQVKSTVDQINTLAGTIRNYNVQITTGQQGNSSLETALNSALEDLSGLTGITALQQQDGTVSVLLGSQTLLVSGADTFPVKAANFTPSNPPPSNPGAPPQIQILDSAGRDITSQATSGSLGGLLDVRNRVLGGIEGNSTQPGALNLLASGFADRVNQLLKDGNISSGPPPVSGVPLFTYDQTNPTNAAASLATTGITGDQLAAITPGPPLQSNGSALLLAGLERGSAPADQIQGLSFTSFAGKIAGDVGAESATAQQNKKLQTDLLTQARSVREQISGVSLNDEAVRVLELQRSYQAAAKLVSVVDEITRTVLALIT